jgi:acetyl esterase
MRMSDLLLRETAIRALALPAPILRRLVGPPIVSPEGWPLDLQSQMLLWMLRVARMSSEYSDVADARRTLGRTSRILSPRAVSDLRTKDVTVPGGEGPRRARIYAPSDARPMVPALLWLHGGGFVLGSIESHDGVCRALATRSGVAVVSLDYRLAPDHPFPGGLEDSLAAARWILREGPEIGIDPRAVAIGGDSAGGNLAAVTAQILRGEARRPVFQLLVYPATDATCSQPSQRSFADGFILTARAIQWFLSHYITDRRLETEPRVSPLLCSDLTGAPPAFVMTAGFDPLRDEGRAYADRLRAAGVAVEYACAKGSMHGFLNTAAALRESSRSLDLAASALRRALGGSATSR